MNLVAYRWPEELLCPDGVLFELPIPNLFGNQTTFSFRSIMKTLVLTVITGTQDETRHETVKHVHGQ
jgi:hypothetical protein